MGRPLGLTNGSIGGTGGIGGIGGMGGGSIPRSSAIVSGKVFSNPSPKPIKFSFVDLCASDEVSLPNLEGVTSFSS